MATIGSLVVNLIANTAGFSAGMQKGIKDTKAFETRLKAITSGVNKVAGALGIVGGAFTAGAFLKGALDEAIEAEKVMKQLETVIASTGMAAGLSANEISDFATELQKTTTFAGGTTKAAAAVLATFKNVKGDVFKDAIKAAQDLAIATGTDLPSAVTKLGAALNDPTKLKGLTGFDVALKEQIKTLAENGEAMKAQRLILDELTKQFGGSAAAALDTTSGKLQQLRNRWNDLLETIGTKVILPTIENTVPVVNAAADSGVFGKAIDAVTAFTIGGTPRGTGYSTGGTMESLPKRITEAAKIQAKVIGKLGTQGFEFGLAGAMKKAFTKNTAVSGLLDTAFGSQFIGRNRENLRGVNQSQFDAWSAARKGGGADMRSEYRPLAALRRGSAEAYSEILRAKGGGDVMAIAKEQLATQKDIAASIKQFDSTLVLLGAN
jgi:hypothetical protein